MAARTYTGPLLDVGFDGEVCQHAAECVRGMPAVFDPGARPWIDAGAAADDASAQRLRDVVGRCPSGALQIIEHEH